MKTEFLKSLGLEQDVIDKIMAENGKDIEAHKAAATAKETELAAANQTIKNLQETVKKFDGVDVAALNQQISELQAKYDTDISAAKLGSALDLALVAGKAKNPKLVKAALDMEKIKLDGDKVLGLDEQLESIRKSDPYLFDDANPGPTLNSGLEHGDPLESGSVDKFISAATAAAGVPSDQK